MAVVSPCRQMFGLFQERTQPLFLVTNKNFFYGL